MIFYRLRNSGIIVITHIKILEGTWSSWCSISQSEIGGFNQRKITCTISIMLIIKCFRLAILRDNSDGTIGLRLIYAFCHRFYPPPPAELRVSCTMCGGSPSILLLSLLPKFLLQSNATLNKITRRFWTRSLRHTGVIPVQFSNHEEAFQDFFYENTTIYVTLWSNFIILPQTQFLMFAK